jgi:hypothetical protein
VKRQLADLVEKQRPAVGLDEKPAARAVGAGKGALGVAEELALQELLGDRAAVDRQEGPLSPVMRTVLSVGATLPARRSTSAIACEVKRYMRESASPITRRSARFSSRRPRTDSICATWCISSSLRTGFTR